MAEDSLVVGARFNGPPGSANGGYVAGLLAGWVPRLLPSYVAREPVRVTLREPPPLETPLRVSDDGAQEGQVAATFGGAVVATAEVGTLTLESAGPVAFAEAAEAEHRYAGLHAHPFPSCFVCGTSRPGGDGMALRPGPVPAEPQGRDEQPGGSAVASTWVPDRSLLAEDGLVAEPFVWASLDCPGAWTSDLTERPMVLGRITAAIYARPEAGDACVVVGRLAATEGRKTLTATAAYDGDGRLLGRADAVWITLR